MTIKFLNTPDGFDPSESCTPEQYSASLDSYEAELEAAIRKDYPDAEVEFFRSSDHPDAPAGGCQITGTDFDPGDIQGDCERIAGLVFETGNFWAA
jgi:hypothetical protein